MKKLFASTPPQHDDPLPYRNIAGERFAERNSERFFSLEYSPRAAYERPRAHEGNLTLMAFRRGPMTTDSAIDFLSTMPRWPGQYEHARAVLARWLAVYHDYGTGRRLVAVGIKVAPFPTTRVQYATGEPRWNPRHEDDPFPQPDPDDQRKNRLEGEDSEF